VTLSVTEFNRLGLLQQHAEGVLGTGVNGR